MGGQLATAFGIGRQVGNMQAVLAAIKSKRHNQRDNQRKGRQQRIVNTCPYNDHIHRSKRSMSRRSRKAKDYYEVLGIEKDASPKI
jgi:preprotein translocase subunit Sec63